MSIFVIHVSKYVWEIKNLLTQDSTELTSNIQHKFLL